MRVVVALRKREIFSAAVYADVAVIFLRWSYMADESVFLTQVDNLGSALHCAVRSSLFLDAAEEKRREGLRSSASVARIARSLVSRRAGANTQQTSRRQTNPFDFSVRGSRLNKPRRSGRPGSKDGSAQNQRELERRAKLESRCARSSPLFARQVQPLSRNMISVELQEEEIFTPKGNNIFQRQRLLGTITAPGLAARERSRAPVIEKTEGGQ